MTFGYCKNSKQGGKFTFKVVDKININWICKCQMFCCKHYISKVKFNYSIKIDLKSILLKIIKLAIIRSYERKRTVHDTCCNRIE